MNRHYDIIIIGAGAAGLLLASRLDLASNNRTGLILEATNFPGNKLRMAGAGHCNFTHAGSVKEMVACYGDSGKAIRRILYRYNNDSFRDYMDTLGFPSYAREDGRVFPRCEDGEQIRQKLLDRARANGFELKTNSAVRQIFSGSTDSQTLSGSVDSQIISGSTDGPDDVDRTEGSRDDSVIWRVTCGNATDSPKATYETSHLILATGGKSYPSTGSNGQMWKILARDLGIPITEPRPALAPIAAKDYPYSELSGLSFADANLSITAPGKKIRRSTGALLLTHRNFSGPAALNISADANTGDTLHINYMPGIPAEELTARITKAFSAAKGSPANVLTDITGLPKRFCEMVIARCIALNSKNSGIRRKDALQESSQGFSQGASQEFSQGSSQSYDGLSPKRISQILTDDIFTVSEEADWNVAMATRGGIDLAAMNLKNMEFKKYPGLFAAGEALDVDGKTGGYNLQFAYSSAAVCAEGLSRKLSM